MPASATVCIVDDDESVRESLAGLLRSFGFAAHAFASAEDFLASSQRSTAHCAIVDVTMPGMSGGDLQEQLLSAGETLPLVFITARAEPALHARLLQRGAVACLVKPFHEQQLLDAVRAAARLTRPANENQEP